MLLHLVDGTGEHAGEAYKTVRAELEAYGQGLEDKHEIVALTKTDALTPEVDQAAGRAIEARQQEDAAAAVGAFRQGRDRGQARAARNHRQLRRHHGGSPPRRGPGLAALAHTSARHGRVVGLVLDDRAPDMLPSTHFMCHAKPLPSPTSAVSWSRSARRSWSMPRPAGRRGVARFARGRYRPPAQGQARHHRRLLRSDRARPLGAASCRKARSSSRTARPPPPSDRSHSPAPGPRCWASTASPRARCW